MNKEKLQNIIKRSQRQFLVEKNEQIKHIARNLIAFLNKENEEDYNALYQFYHSVKGTSGTLELHDISLVAADIEELMVSKKEHLASDPEYYSELVKGTGNLLDLIEQRLSAVLIENMPMDPSNDAVGEEILLSGKILIVDDDVSMLDFLEELLKNQGFEVFVTNNGNDAIEYLKSEKIDLAIIDVVMPKKSGFDVYEEIRELNIDTPIIFLTGLSKKEIRYEALRKGAEIIYQKPVDPDELIARINGTIKKIKINEDQNQRDELTNAFTRKHFIKRFEKEKEHFIKHDEAFSVAFLDLDYFKNINDTHGHLFGDQVLISFVEVITANLEKDREVFRFGGDEFLILFPQTTGEEAKLVMEHIKLDMLSKVFPAPDDKGDIPVTFSSGIAELNSKEQSKTSLLEKADKALYIAKEKGKNQIILQNERLRVSKNKILVVDDELLLTNIIKTRLGYLGYDVEYAKDGQEALDKLGQHTYDLVLLDIMLPKVTGIEVLKKMKAVSLSVNPKIIMISGKHSEATVMESLKLGADDFFEKPFSLDVLEHKIKKILTT
ncbi:MAG: response regulator [Alkalibacterium sp.]|uniref:GGDEF domain-containing response regulator n=1 Tax=Alkalibacterium sp. TaxID=1872447 RepID=UPI0039709C1E